MTGRDEEEGLQLVLMIIEAGCAVLGLVVVVKLRREAVRRPPIPPTRIRASILRYVQHALLLLFVLRTPPRPCVPIPSMDGSVLNVSHSPPPNCTIRRPRNQPTPILTRDARAARAHSPQDPHGEHEEEQAHAACDGGGDRARVELRRCIGVL